MKKTNSVVLLIVSLLLIIIGGGIYFAQKSGRFNISAAFEGWPDVPTTDPAYTELMAIGERGLMTSYSDGTFKPESSPDRAQVVVSIVKGLGLNLIDASLKCNEQLSSTYPFTDVPCSHWAIDYIWTAKEANIIAAYPDGSFQSDRVATNAEMIAMMIGATANYIPNFPCTGLSDYPFDDVPCDYWAYDYIKLAKEAKVIFANSAGNFEPDADTSRRNLGVILYRTFVADAIEVTISGNVTDATTGEPIAGVSVYVVDDAARGDALSAQTDSSGAYSLKFVSATTTYTINASSSGYQSKSVSTSAAQASTLNIALSQVSETEGVITGYVRDADSGAAISGANVTILGYESGSRLSDQTDSRGFYSLRVGSTTGTFTIKVTASNYQAKTLSATLSNGSDNLNFALAKATDLSDNGETPNIGGGGNGNVNAVNTGSVLSVALVLIGTILALLSLMYLLKINKEKA